MELKFRKSLLSVAPMLRSNRTFMELKSPTYARGAISAKVLIVPLWNLNRRQQITLMVAPRSNRTFMELK